MDAFADSVDSKIYSVRLRARGNKEIDNLESLVENMPAMIHSEHEIECHLDRGYGKLPIIEILSKKGYTVLTLASTLGSKHPFLFEDDVEKKSRIGKAKTSLTHGSMSALAR